MRIVQLVPTLGVGGAERIVGLLATELRALGHRVDVVALGARSDSWIEAGLAEAGVPMHFLDKGPGLELGVVRRLARCLRRLRPDVVHTHLHVLKYLLPACPRRRGPVIVHTLHNLAEQEAVRHDRTIQRLAFRGRVKPVAIGDAVAASAEALYGRPARATIPNGVPVAEYQRPPQVRAPTRAALGLDASTPMLLMVGRLNAQKNHRLALAALADPAVRATGAVLCVAGSGDLRDQLVEQARVLGVEQNLRLLGVRADVPDLLAACDAFVLSSAYEGNPLVVMEAMAAGRAVISTDVGCVAELITRDTGRLVPPGDVDALAGAIAELAADPAASRGLGAAAAARARARFDAPVMASAYAALFEQLLVESRG